MGSKQILPLTASEQCACEEHLGLDQQNLAVLGKYPIDMVKDITKQICKNLAKCESQKETKHGRTHVAFASLGGSYSDHHSDDREGHSGPVLP